MIISRIEVSNFKSFREAAIDLRPLNIVIGANAAGKSNFVEVFQFLSDIEKNGLENAIAMHGGREFILNTQLGREAPLNVSVRYIPKTLANKEMPLHPVYQLRCTSIRHSFSIKFAERGHGYRVAAEKLEQEFELSRREVNPAHLDFENGGTSRLVVERRRDKLFVLEQPLGKVWEGFGTFVSLVRLTNEPLPKEELLTKQAWLPFWAGPLDNASSIAAFDIDPKLPKRAVPMTGRLDLEPSGENLAIVLKNILEDTDSRRKILNLLKDVLPFIDDVAIEKMADKSMFFSLRENFIAKNAVPSSLLSDGSIHIVALIVALYFVHRDVIIIEEPERNIHAALIEKVTSLLAEASERRQVIATTHSPELLRYIDLEDLLLISRDKQGYSTITRPADAKAVHIFLQNEVGLDDLLVQNLFGVNA